MEESSSSPRGRAPQPRDLTPEERAELRTGRAIRNLLNVEGWHVYRKILEAHLLAKRNELEAPAETSSDGIAQVLRFEAVKGSIIGLRLALAIPEGILSGDKMLRQTLGLAATEDDDDQ